jgi:hypothetical protein
MQGLRELELEVLGAEAGLEEHLEEVLDVGQEVVLEEALEHGHGVGEAGLLGLLADQQREGHHVLGLGLLAEGGLVQVGECLLVLQEGVD